MVIKVHSKSGRSFKGCIAYLLHPGQEAGKNRVAWVATQNLGTNNGKVAAAIMAATANRREELKASAGVAKSGTKAKGGPVMHYSISFHEDESKGLTAEQMKETALASLAVLGREPGRRKGNKAIRRQFGDEHQAVIVCHSEPNKHKHVHICLNRAHPTHGALLHMGQDHLKLSKFALAYARRTGIEVCPQRPINAAARKEHYKKGEKDLARPLYEAQKKVSHANRNKRPQIERQQRDARNIGLAKKALTERQRIERLALEREFLNRNAALRKDCQAAIKTDKRPIRDKFVSRRQKLYAQREASLAAFDRRSENWLGRLLIKWQSVDLKAIVGGWKPPGSERNASALAEQFNRPVSIAEERRKLVAQYEQRWTQINVDERAQIKAAVSKRRLQKQLALVESRVKYDRDRSGLDFKHRGEKAAIGAGWTEHLQASRKAWREMERETPRRDASMRPGGAQTKASNLASADRHDRGEAAQVIDHLKQISEGLAHRAKDGKRDIDRDKGGDRER